MTCAHVHTQREGGQWKLPSGLYLHVTELCVAPVQALIRKGEQSQRFVLGLGIELQQFLGRSQNVFE